MNHSFSGFCFVFSKIISFFCSVRQFSYLDTNCEVCPPQCAAAGICDAFLFLSTVALLTRLPGNSLCLHNLRIRQDLGRGRAPPLCGFVALADSPVISSCSASFGFCPLILQTLMLQLLAAQVAHISGMHSIIKSSKT